MVINVKQSVHSMLLTGWLKTRVHPRDHNYARVKRDSGQSQCRNIVRSEMMGHLIHSLHVHQRGGCDEITVGRVVTTERIPEI